MSDRPRTARDVPGAPLELLESLVALAGRFGRDPEYSRGGGGNASLKADGVLYIKPSGIPLASLAIDDLVPLAIDPLLEALHGGPLAGGGEAATTSPGPAGSDPVMAVAATARLADVGGRRPSVELLFHALHPERFVLHTHPILPNAVTCSRDGAIVAGRLFGDRVLWIPYIDPGLPLARAILEGRRAFEARTGRRPPPVTMLQNHGLVVAADSPDEIAELSSWVMSTVVAELGVGGSDDGRLPRGREPEPPDAGRTRALVDALGPSLRALLADGDRPGDGLKVVTFDANLRTAAFLGTPEGRAVVAGGPLTPDQIVYAGSWPLVVDPPDDLEPGRVQALLRARLDAHLEARGELPIVVVLPGCGLFAAGDSWAQADTARHVYLDALRIAEEAVALGGVRPLADAERRFIEAWEAEAYRKRVAAREGTPGRFGGRVAVVTGAAQGFGLAIATDLVREGGHVVLADVNAAPAEANARELEARFGRGRAMAVAVDVTDEGSLADGIHAAVERYGGLDLLVSNAGVLRAGSVTGQAVADFDLVTRVNYRGYFLGVRAVVPVLALQHRARPSYWADIIEINSKSGLVGSSRNSAYAGSKFGGIGLTQSFALELVGDGIKVNAICPGNYLDGPLWSDPENGLFVQYLREGKVPGAETVEDVRHFYEAKVPMGRGCTPADVLEALYYLVHQRYETGQALPVTGGQVMLG